MKLLGIVILYHPLVDVLDNINSYINVLDKLIVWDNTPGGSNIDFPDKWNIEKMGLNENVGIGKALNEAVNYAQTNNFTHLLTMDQDSHFMDGHCREYIDTIIKFDKEAIYGPNYLLHGQKLFKEQDDIIENEATMTSGSVFPISIFERIGVFRADFFVACVDNEFCYRAKLNKIPTFNILSILLFHEAGYQKEKHKFLWKTFTPNEYSPMRSYYIIRNLLLTKKLYPWANYKGILYYYFYKRIFFVLCYEHNKYQKIKALLLGYLHGKLGKTGKLIYLQ